MENLFASTGMAAGYAAHRPPVHPEVLRLAATHQQQRHLGAAGATISAPVGFEPTYALDVGCGSGVSAKALRDVLPQTSTVVGLEPAESMLRSARAAGMLTAAVAGRAESLPFASGTFGLITAAGSLNYTDDLPAFFTEAARVLHPSSGSLVVYDFSPGRIMTGDDLLQHWFDKEFMVRYPRAKDNAKFLDPATLEAIIAGAGSPLAMTWANEFRIPLMLDYDFYVNYMMTETNVAYAVAGGASEASIRDWCRRTLEPMFRGGPKEVLFEGYVAMFAPVSR